MSSSSSRIVRAPSPRFSRLLTIAACVTIVVRFWRRLFSRHTDTTPIPPTEGPVTSARLSTAVQSQQNDPAYPEKLETTEKELLRTRRDGKPCNNIVGVGLSGGGIRSATFCLGIFQGLAKQKLLSKIDYLSTVSGGGYFGAFYGRLFTRDKVQTIADVEEILAPRAASAIQAAAVGETFPPGRVFKWLRENGRYLAPSGSGDVLLAGAVMFRNFVAVHVVLATFLLMIFLAAQLLRGGIEFACQAGQCPFWDSFQGILALLAGAKGGIWWSPYVALVPVLFLFFAVPPGWCYWLVEKPNRSIAGSWIPPFYGWLAAVLLSLPGLVIGACRRLDLPAGCGIASKPEGLIAGIVAFLDKDSTFMVSIVVLIIAVETMACLIFKGYWPRVSFQKKGSGKKNQSLIMKISDFGSRSSLRPR